MNKIIQIKADNIDKEASVWISRLDRGLSESERLDLNDWLDLSARHNIAFQEQAECWDKTEALSSLVDLFPGTIKQPLSAYGFYEWRVWSGTGAACIALTLVWLAIFSLMENTSMLSPKILTFETTVGGLSRIVLEDNSTLMLNTATKVNVSMTESVREITIDSGEIYVDVAHDPLRPLRVNANGNVFEALGTKFNIRIDESDNIELLVTEGKVNVRMAPKPATFSLDNSGDLTPALLIEQGKRVMLKGEIGVVELLVDADIEAVLSWRQGNIIFRGEPLSEAIAEINRYTSVEYLLLDESLRGIKIAGLFKAGDASGFLASLEENFDIRYEVRGQKTFLLRPSRLVPK